ncbi:MAG: phosphatase PAP2 family protein [Bacteroidales bacterium]
MYALSYTYTWIPLYIFLLILLFTIYKKESWVIVLGLILLIAVVDISSVHLFKNVFERLRPSHEPLLEGLIYVPYGQGGLYGFISSHAANHFALAACLTPLLAKRFICFKYGILYLWAFMIAYSRIYLGKHYIGDVLVGALWGLLLGYGCYKLIRLVLSKVYPSTP